MKLILTIFFWGSALCATAQSNFSHTNAKTGSTSYTDISSTGTAIAMTNAETGSSSIAQNIGFNFNFNGTVFTQFMIHADGILRFGTSAPGAATSIATDPSSSYSTVMTSTGTTFQNIVMPFFCDLVQGNSTPEFHVQTTGSSPNRVCIIQWKNLRDADNTGSTLQHQFDNMEFQVKLYETTNDIEMVYGNWVASSNTVLGRFAATGIKATSSSFITIYRARSTDLFSFCEFLNQPANVELPSRNPFRKTVIPPIGHNYTFFGKIADDINITELYVDNAVPNTSPVGKNIQVNIKNEGTNAATNIPVTLTVTGANSYTETINITSLSAGSSQVVNFSAFAVPVKGDQTVTVSIVPTVDGRIANNSQSATQHVTAASTQLFDVSKKSTVGIGFNSGTGMMGIKIFGNGTRKISQIRTFFNSSNNAYDIRIHEDGGVGNTPSTPFLFKSASLKTDSDNETVITVNPPITVTGDYYIVVAQQATTNLGVSSALQYPRLPQTVYDATLDGTSWTESPAAKGWHHVISIIEESSLVDVGIESVASPSCTYSNNENVSFKLRNFSSATHDYATNPVTITGFAKDSVNNITTPFSIIKNTGTLAPSASETITVLSGYNFLPRGYHIFNAKTICTADIEPSNDSLNFKIFNAIPISKDITDTICPFIPVTLTAPTSFLSNHEWHTTNAFNNAIEFTNELELTPEFTATYFISATDYRGCTLKDSITVAVRASGLAPAPILISADTIWSHRNAFIATINIAPLADHTINWISTGSITNNGETLTAKGSNGSTLHQAYYTRTSDGCNGNGVTIHTSFANGLLLDNTANPTFCDTSFYDDGGPVTNYTLGTKTRTFIPATPDSKMKLSIYNLSLASNSNLKIYDGTDATAPILANLTNTNNGETLIEFSASSTSGALTVSLEPSSLSGSGWLAGLTCYAPLQFRTTSNGAFSSVGIWESKAMGGTTFSPATRLPNKSDDSIWIAHAVTLDSNLSIDQLTIESTGSFTVQSGIILDPYPTIPGYPIVVNGSLIMDNSSSLSHTVSNMPCTVLVNGNITNNGSIDVDTLVMAGTGGVPSTMAGANTLRNVKVNSTTGVTVSSNVDITGFLDLQKGIVTVPPANFLRVYEHTPIINASANSFINGKLRRFEYTTSTSLSFPVGKNNRYRNIELNVNQTSSDNLVLYEVELIEGIPTARSLPSGINNVNSQWYHKVSIIDGNNFFSNATIKIDYINGDGVNAPANLRLVNDNGSNWVSIGGVGTSASFGSITSNAVTAFGDIVLANLGIEQTITWNGSTSNNWNTASNWTPATVPVPASLVVIPATGVTNEPSLPTSTSIAVLILETGRVLTINNGTLTITGNLVNKGTINGNGVTELTTSISHAITGTGSIANLTINSNEATIGAGASHRVSITNILRLQSGIFNTNGNLVLKSTALGTAMLDTVGAGLNTGTINGEVEVERFIPAGQRSFRFIAPSVITSNPIRTYWQEGANNTSNGFANNQNPNPGYGTHITGSNTGSNGFDITSTGNASLFVFDNVTQTWFAANNTNSNILFIGEAYRILIRGNRGLDLNTQPSVTTATTLRAKGTVYTGVHFALLAANANEFSFIGNPYPASIDWHSILGNLGTTSITPTYHIWDPTQAGSNNRGNYQSYNQLTGMNNGGNMNRYIQSGQAFFVQNDAVGPLFQMEILETNKAINILGNQTNTFRTQANVKGRIWLRLFTKNQFINNGAMADGVGIAFSPTFKKAIENDDALKLTGSDENLSINNNKKLLSITGLPMPSMVSDTIFLNLQNCTGTNYVLQAESKDFSSNNVEAFLVDRYTQQKQLLNLNNGTVTLPFEIATSIPASLAKDRFMIVYAQKYIEPVANKMELKIAPNPATDFVQVTYKAKQKGLATIKVINNAGQLIQSLNLGEQEDIQVKIAVSKWSAGMYTLELTVGDEKETAKLIKQ